MEKICELNVTLSSPLEIEDSLFLVAQNGEIYKLKEGQLKVNFPHLSNFSEKANFIIKNSLD